MRKILKYILNFFLLKIDFNKYARLILNFQGNKKILTSYSNDFLHFNHLNPSPTNNRSIIPNNITKAARRTCTILKYKNKISPIFRFILLN